jgi:hypothetical protein
MHDLDGDGTSEDQLYPSPLSLLAHLNNIAIAIKALHTSPNPTE